jgi:hypothetical protein
MIQNSETSNRSTSTDRRTARSQSIGPLLIWEMAFEANEAQCVANVVPPGIEVQYILNGSMLSSHRFDRAEEVLSWASRKQLTLQKRGWERA